MGGGLAGNWTELLFFVMLSVLAELFPYAVRHLWGTGFGFAVNLACIIALGPVAAVLVSFCGGVIGGHLNRHKKTPIPVEMGVFPRAAMAALATGYAGLSYLVAGGQPGGGLDMRDLMAIPFASASYLLVNSFMMAAWLAMRHGVSAFDNAMAIMRSRARVHALLSIIGSVMAGIYMSMNRGLGIEGVALFSVFVVVVIYAARLNVGMHEVYWDTIRALMGSIEAKDRYTHGHSLRVAEYAAMTARRLMLEEGSVATIYCASLLHDLGKVALGDSLLNKQGKLSAEEYRAVCDHPVVGYNIVRHIYFPAGMAELVLHHHERYDGSGYPLGLSGNDIPLGARIIAVANAFDAMTSERAYRRALGDGEALGELSRAAGSEFDPAVVKAFISARDEMLRRGVLVRAGGDNFTVGGISAGRNH